MSEICWNIWGLHVKACGWLAIVVASMLGAQTPSHPSHGAREDLFSPLDALYKSPINMVLSPDGKRLFVVCERSASLMVIDTEAGQLLGETPVGPNPFDVALSHDATTLYVSNRWDDSVWVLDAHTLDVQKRIPVGIDPHGLALSRDGKTLYVANFGENTISVIAAEDGTELKRLRAGVQPFDLVLSVDGRYLFVSNQMTQPVPFRTPPCTELTVIRTDANIVEDRIALPGTDICQGITVTPDGELVLLVTEIPKNLIPETQIYQGWMVTYALAVVEARPGGRAALVLLDDMNLYFADPFDVTVTSDNRLAVISSSGVDRLSVVDLEKLKSLLRVRDGRIHLDETTRRRFARHLALSHEFVVRRLETGFNPKGLAISGDNQTVFVANRLADTVSAVALDTGEIRFSVDLGGAEIMTQLRWGEYLFNHATISFQKQLSCNTCHPENHVDGLIYDIAVDGGLGGNLVDNRTLRGVAFTAPFKWSGRNPNLARQEGPRAAQLFFRTHGFRGSDRDAVVAYIESIPLPPNRRAPRDDSPLNAAQSRGKELFLRAQTNDGRYIPVANRCVTCHPPPFYTDRAMHDVGTRAYFDTHGEFDTPQLNRIAESAPYLHDGRCWSLEDIWTLYNPYDLHGVANDLTKQQLNDLIEYLKTL